MPPVAALYMRTLRIELVNDGVIDKLKGEHGGFLCAFWHNRMLPLIWVKRHQGVAALVSPSRDGEIVARILSRFGYHVVRGSTYKQPVAGAKAVVRLLREGRIVAVIPDGPRGPVYTVSPGVVALARLSGSPILPASCMYSDYWELNSWDMFMIPKPFSQVVVGFGDPLFVKRDEDLHHAAVRLRKALFALERRLWEELKRF